MTLQDLSKKPLGTQLLYFCGGNQGTILRSTKYVAKLEEADLKKKKVRISYTNELGVPIKKMVDPENLDLLRA